MSNVGNLITAQLHYRNVILGHLWTNLNTLDDHDSKVIVSHRWQWSVAVRLDQKQ
ncbi:mCG147468 [Mus musculus]|nr:mCG147468 [Mus musculus]